MSRKLLNLCLTALFSVVSTAAWALSEVGGVYQIGTAEDLVAFAELVNGDNPYACAVLTADIVKPYTDESMIGRDGQDFQGTFDGQGHTITIDMYPRTSQGMALFRNVGVHAIIQNLKVQGNMTTDQKLAAGIAVWCNGIIRGCYVDIVINTAVTNDGTHAGVVAVGNRGLLIENCLVKFKILGSATQNCGGLVGWLDNPANAVNNLVISDGSTLDLANGGSANIARNGGNLRTIDLAKYNEDPYANRPAGGTFNNYVTNQWGNNVATTVVNYDDLADGRICYQLNTDQSKINWVQRIGTDPFPVPAAFGKGQVYSSVMAGCDGKIEADATFSNSGVAQPNPHLFDKYGICPNCGAFNFDAFDFDDPTRYDPTDRTVLLNSADDIYLCEGWNRVGDGFKLNMKMANDIECIAPGGQLIFNDVNWVDGNFNGQGNQLTIEMADIEVNNASFIPKMTGIFENVIMHGTISTSGQFAGSVTSHTYGDKVIIRNVFSDIDFNVSHAGDNTSAGIIGVSESKTLVENVIYAGDINGNEASTECLAGFCGWASGQTYFNNCAFIGTLNGAIGDSKNVSRNPGNVTPSNVYLLQDFGFDDTDKFEVFEGGEAGVASGMLAYYLNGKQQGVERFYQKIGVDNEPMPIKKDGALVYSVAASYRCDGAPVGNVSYSNTPSTATLPPHNYTDGFCTVCGSLQEDFMTPVDGWFEISDGAQLVWWSNYAAKHLDASAKLVDNIDMSGYCDRWANVGTEGAPFYGNFDGQFHTISNLVIDHPNDNGVGLIAVMNSLPTKGFGNITDQEARDAEGVYIKNVVLDESCTITGRGYVGLVGMTANWAGHVNIKGVMMCGDVYANGGPNASGVFGCVMGSSCHVTIDNCGMTGDVYGPKENGSFSGWLGSYAEVTNCFAVGSVEGIQDDDHYFARYNSATFTNCYARYGTQVPIVSEEDFASGALAWRANGNQFRTSYWYQTLGEDPYPYPDPSHGTVIFAAEQYFSVADENDLAAVAAEVQEYENGQIVDIVAATQALLDGWQEAINALAEAETVLAFADAIDAVAAAKKAVLDNAAYWDAYIAKCEEVKAFLESENTPEGDLRDALYYYLTEYDEPSDENPLGTFEYIKENLLATGEEIQEETKRVDQWLSDAIAEDYKPGQDISKLIPNYDFSQQKEHWTNGWSTGYGRITNGNGETVNGVEAWNVTGDQYQTLEDMKPGFYLVGINGAFRPSNNRYSTNYAAGIYANGIFNYFPTVIEDYVNVDEAEDGVNCNLTIKSAYDLAIYDDGFSENDENGATIIGYAVHGETGMAYAASVGRYQVYTIAHVGEDGKLTIGIKNPGTKYSSDWTGWGALQVRYCGTDDAVVGDALSTVLANMNERIETIMEYQYDEDVPEAAPNFPEALRAELQAAQTKINTANTVEAKAAVAEEISDIFQRIYEGKRAYIPVAKTATSLEFLETGNLALVKKDAETGEWTPTGEMLFSDDENFALYEVAALLHQEYAEGSLSTEEALNINSQLTDVASILPEKDDEGYYLLSTPKHLAAFRALVNSYDNTVKAKMVNDIDMTGIAMEPIGYADHIWTSGVFDGQGHSLSNVYINTEFMTIQTNSDPATLFYELKKATVKNLKLTGEYRGNQKFMGGLTRWMSEGSTVDNCDIAVAIYSDINGDGTHGGVVGVISSDNETVNNCLIHNDFYSIDGVTTTCIGGVCGWAGDYSMQVKNTLILNNYVSVSDDGSDTVSRNGSTVSNVFTDKTFGGAAGTVVTADQLATGEIAYRLNGSQSDNPVWFQTIGTEPTPHLFGGDVVYYYGGAYINDKPNPQLNAFAYDLRANKVAGNVVVSYTLNAEAEAVKVTFKDGTWSYDVVVEDAEGLTAGAHKVTVPVTQLGVSDPMALNYEVQVKGKGCLDVRKIGDSYKFNSPYGLAVNNNPASKGFGQVLITETRPTEDREGMFSTGTPGALFAFNAGFQPVGSYYGGLEIADETPITLPGNYQLDLKDIRFSKDGRLFVGRAAGLSASSVYEINPDALDKDWTPVFTGGELDEATGITYVGDEEQTRPAVGLALEGEGDNLKMYVLGCQGGVTTGESVATSFNCSVYDLGTAKEWTSAPSSSFEPLNGVYAAIPTHVGIHEDRQGGLWFMQNAGSLTDETPALKHFDAAGVEDYNGSTSTSSGKMAISSDGMYLAIPQGSGKVVIFETNYVPMANGRIYLNPIHNISTTESSVTGLAFDFADNLYVASSGSKTLSRYVIPSWRNNIAVTPGNGVGNEGGDVNCDGTTDIADAVSVLNAMAGEEVAGDADVNGDGAVDIADFVTVLNLMAGE